MRKLIVPLVVLALASVLPAVAAPAGVAKSGYAPTQRIVVRPVDSTGRARPGFAVAAEPNGQVDCTDGDESPGAVSRNILVCFPSAEYAIACWKPVTPQMALCMRDPSHKRLVQIPRNGRFASASVVAKWKRAPLLIVLLDGTRCGIRDGGAWGSLKGHPNMFGTYSCTRHGVVWAKPKSRHMGVNESSAAWTVRTAPDSGPLVTRHVKRAYFVGTFHG